MEQSDADRNALPPHIDEGTAHAWLDDALSPEEAEGVASHVAACTSCAALVAEARGLIAASSRIVTALDDVPGGVLPSSSRSAPTAPRVAARRQHDDVRLVPPARTGRRMPSWARGLAAAASLVVVTGTVLRLSGGADGVASVAGSYEQAASDTAASGPSAASATSAPSMAPAAEGAAAVPLPVRTPPPPSPVADAADRAASIGAAARMERSRVASTPAPKAMAEREVLALQQRASGADASAKAVAAAPPPAAPVAPPAAPPVVAAQRAAGSGGGAAAANAARSPAQGAVASATAETRFLADQSTRQAPSLPFTPGTIERRAGCYAITRGGQATTSAPPPSTVRLTDSALTMPPTTWLRARLAGDASGSALSWSPIDSARAMLRVAAATDTSTFIITFAAAGAEREGRAAAGGWVATRVECR